MSDPLLDLKRMQLQSQINENAAQAANYIRELAVKESALVSEQRDRTLLTRGSLKFKGKPKEYLQFLAETNVESLWGLKTMNEQRLAIVSLMDHDQEAKNLSSLSYEDRRAYKTALMKAGGQPNSETDAIMDAGLARVRAQKSELADSKLQSTPGKMLHDRALLVKQNGEGSAEVAAFDKQVEAQKRTGVGPRELQLREAAMTYRSEGDTESADLMDSALKEIIRNKGAASRVDKSITLKIGEGFTQRISPEDYVNFPITDKDNLDKIKEYQDLKAKVASGKGEKHFLKKDDADKVDALKSELRGLYIDADTGKRIVPGTNEAPTNAPAASAPATGQFKSADEVKNAFQAGAIDRDTAKEILANQFNMK
jgi:hypothetical protein